MWQTWAPVISAIVVAVVGIVVPLVNSRNDRVLTDQEVDILRKLDPNSKAAKELSAVIEARVSQWYQRAYRVQKTPTGPVRKQRSGSLVIVRVVQVFVIFILVVIIIQLT